MKAKMQDYIIQKKELYQLIYLFVNAENVRNDYYSNFTNFIINQKIAESISELKLLISLLVNISSDLHCDSYLLEKVGKIFFFLKNDIKKMLPNHDIFKIAINNKMLLLFLIENDIITIDSNVINMILNIIQRNSIPYYYFYFPEIKQHIDSEKLKIIENELLKYDSNIFINFKEKRRKGENEAYICSLIRNDSINEFINYVEKNDILLTSIIKPSLFETNSFLIKNNPTLVQYAAFYGSIKIFKYLKSKNIKLSPSLWLHAIHSNNLELIHLLDQYKVIPPKKSYEKCFCESIKCHHNDITNYILINKLNNNDENIYNEKTMRCVLHYNNYQFFPDVFKRSNDVFYSLFNYGYLKLILLYLEPKKDLIIQNKILFLYII